MARNIADIYSKYEFICSDCGCAIWAVEWAWDCYELAFCPHCGAIMEESDD